MEACAELRGIPYGSGHAPLSRRLGLLASLRSRHRDRHHLTFVPNRSDLLRAFLPPTLIALIALLVGGVLGGWLLAGRMLSPLARITEATRVAGTGALSHRIHMDDRGDEFGKLADAFDGMLAKLELHISEQHGLFLTIAGSSADVLGSSPLLLQMITNLVHNAIVHNLPQGGPGSSEHLSGANASDRSC